MPSRTPLPTLIGSDFLMNQLSLRPTGEGAAWRATSSTSATQLGLGDWRRAAGDFPVAGDARHLLDEEFAGVDPNDPFGPIFGRRQSQLMHKDILSNKLVMHILPLPEQGKPAGFTGAIGQVPGRAATHVGDGGRGRAGDARASR